MSILKIACEAVFEPSLLFYDKKNIISNALWKEEYKNWQTDALSTFLYNADLTEYSFISFEKAAYIKENSNDLEDATKDIKKFTKMIESYTNELNIKEIVRLGMRTISYKDIGLNYSEIVKKITPKIYPDPNSKIFEITAKTYEDVAYASVFIKDGLNIKFEFGPVKKDEMINRAQQRFAAPKDLPEDSLYFDLDCFLTNVSTKDVDKKINEFKEKSSSILEQSLKYLDQD